MTEQASSGTAEARQRPTDGAAAHADPADAVLAALGTDPARGLDQAEARRRLERDGPNRLRSAAGTPWWRRLLAQFESVLVIILLVATGVSLLEWLLQEPRETALP
jgi:magnesium-transporting ATPase (P-type)